MWLWFPQFIMEPWSSTKCVKKVHEIACCCDLVNCSSLPTVHTLWLTKCRESSHLTLCFIAVQKIDWSWLKSIKWLCNMQKKNSHFLLRGSCSNSVKVTWSVQLRCDAVFLTTSPSSSILFSLLVVVFVLHETKSPLGESNYTYEKHVSVMESLFTFSYSPLSQLSQYHRPSARSKSSSSLQCENTPTSISQVRSRYSAKDDESLTRQSDANRKHCSAKRVTDMRWADVEKIIALLRSCNWKFKQLFFAKSDDLSGAMNPTITGKSMFSLFALKRYCVISAGLSMYRSYTVNAVKDLLLLWTFTLWYHVGLGTQP